MSDTDNKVENVVEANRADLRYSMPLGSVLKDMKGRQWVFVGLVKSVEGHNAFMFVRATDGMVGVMGAKERLWGKCLSTVGAMERAFPDAGMYLNGVK